jgi:hypothetical protein
VIAIFVLGRLQPNGLFQPSTSSVKCLAKRSGTWNSAQATVTTMRALRPPWQSCDKPWPIRVKPLWVITDMKHGGIKAAMSSMALFDVVNTSAWIWRVHYGRSSCRRAWLATRTRTIPRRVCQRSATTPSRICAIYSQPAWSRAVMGLERVAVVVHCER